MKKKHYVFVSGSLVAIAAACLLKGKLDLMLGFSTLSSIVMGYGLMSYLIDAQPTLAKMNKAMIALSIVGLGLIVPSLFSDTILSLAAAFFGGVALGLAGVIKQYENKVSK